MKDISYELNVYDVIAYKKEIRNFYNGIIYVKRKLKNRGANDIILSAFDVERKQLFSEVKHFIMDCYIKQDRAYDLCYASTLKEYKSRLDTIFEKYLNTLHHQKNYNNGEEVKSDFSSIEISNENQPKSLQSADSYFIELGDQGNYSFMYDRYTKVMYTQYYSLKSGTTSLTVMLKADGSPLTYDEWKQNVFEEKNE